MSLTEKQKRHLRAMAHKLKPVVLTGGAGVTEAVLKEIDRALEHHELIKVRVNAGDREERQAMNTAITEATGSELVQGIGHIAVLYRRAKKPRITLP